MKHKWPGMLFAALALVVCSLFAGKISAAEFYGSSMTIPYFFQSSFAGNEKDHASLFEYANVHAQNFGVTGMTLHFAGWGRYDAADTELEDQKQPGDADLTYAYVEWTGVEGALRASLGRQFIALGPTLENMDSLLVTIGPFVGFKAQGFGGIPTVSKIGERDGDAGAGGRISYRCLNYFEFGASYASFAESFNPDRENVGGDLYVSPFAWVDLTGHGYYDLIFGEMYDAAGVLNVFPIQDLRLQAAYSRVMPQQFLGKMSYFSVFSAETIDKIDGELSYLFLGRHLRILGGYGSLTYDQGDDATRAGGGMEVLWGPARENSLGARYYRLSKLDNGYDEIRGAFFQKLGAKFHVAANAAGYFLDDPIYGTDTGIDSDLSLGWRISPKFSIQATNVYRSTPYYTSDYRALVKIAYNVERPL